MAKTKPVIPGQSGGKAVFSYYGPKHMAEIGRLGGQKTVKRYGKKFMGLVGSLANENMSKTRRVQTVREINRRVNG
jgi:general stress protein YciG